MASGQVGDEVVKQSSSGANASYRAKRRKSFVATNPCAAIEMKKELMDMPFEEIQKLKEKIGTKLVNKALFQKMPTKPKEYENLYRHRPKEVSSKIRVREAPKIVIGRIKTKESITRDPRFDDLSGTFKEDLFKQSYGFVDEIRADEKKQLETELAESKNPKKCKQIKKVILKMTTKEKEEAKKEKDKKFKAEMKREQIASIKEGRKPYFMKESDKKTLNLVEMFEDLKKTGKLDQYLAKKRQRNASVLRKKLPN